MLAVVTEQYPETARPEGQVVPIDEIWSQITSLSWQEAVVGIAFGVVCLMYGWRIFRVLVVICFGLMGIFAGMMVGQRFGTADESIIWGGVLGMIVLAALAIPLMKWSVSILGAVAGGVLTGGLWYALGLSQDYIAAGIVIGIVAGGLISFILLKVSVMLFTSLGGSALLVTGLLALLYQYETIIRNPPTNNIQDWVYSKPWFLPLALLGPTIIGILMQNKFIKTSNKFSL